MAKTAMLLTGAIVIIIVVAAAALLLGNSAPSHSTTTAQQSAAATSTNSSAILFATSQYAQISYLLYSPRTNRTSYEAAGFNVSIRKLANGSIAAIISMLSDPASNSTFTFLGTDSLYFIDSSLGDDSPPSGDYNLGDDGTALVNSTGYLTTK